MSGQGKQEPQILGTDDLKTEAKWLKMQKIRWRDQEGKDVGSHSHVYALNCKGGKERLICYSEYGKSRIALQDLKQE